MKIVDRYLTAEVMGPFLVGVVGFILVLAVDLLFTMADLIINKGVPFWAMLKLLIYKLPSMLVLTFPVSTIFGTTMALGRLSENNELTALRTSGVSLFRIAAPILVIGILVSIISFFTNEMIVPYANFVSNNLIRQIIYKQPLPEVKENVFFKDAFNRFYYARRVNMKNKSMEGVVVYEVTDEKFPRVILADFATFSGKVWQLKKGVIHKYDAQGYLSYSAAFSDMTLMVSEDILTFTEQKTAQDMNTKELKNMIQVLERGGANTKELLTEFYLRYSIPFTCFVFALVGIPFSLASPRSNRTWGLLVTIVFMFTFYVFASVFRSLGRGGIFPPIFAAFTPQVTFIILGFILLYREGKFH